jgi:hypothetical protein
MLTGRPAFGALDVDELADAILNAQPPSAVALRPEVSPLLDQVIARARAKRPGERFPTAVAMLEALRPFGAGSEEVGEMRVPAVGRGYGKLQLRGNTPRRSTCLALAGFIEVLLELAGGRDVEVVVSACRALGDTACHFDANSMV